MLDLEYPVDRESIFPILKNGPHLVCVLVSRSAIMKSFIYFATPLYSLFEDWASVLAHPSHSSSYSLDRNQRCFALQGWERSIPGSIRQAKALFPCLSSWCLSPMHVFHLLYPGRHSWVHIRHWQAIPLYRFLCRMLAGTSPTSMPHEMATSKRLDCTLHKSLVLCSICRQTLWGCYHIFPHLWKWIFCGHFVLKLVYSLNLERLRQVLGVEVVLGWWQEMEWIQADPPHETTVGRKRRGFHGIMGNAPPRDRIWAGWIKHKAQIWSLSELVKHSYTN